MSEQWSQEQIDRRIPSLRDRVALITMVVHARDYLFESDDPMLLDRINARELLIDGLQNAMESSSTGLEWWTLRHRLTPSEIQSGSWMDEYKTSWISARQAEQARNGKQR